MLSRAGLTPSVVARLDNIPAGRWIVMFSVELNFFHPGGMYGTCVATSDGTDVAGTSGVYGGAAGSTRAMPLAAFGQVTSADEFDLTVHCRHDAELAPSDPAMTVQNRSLAAIRVE